MIVRNPFFIYSLICLVLTFFIPFMAYSGEYNSDIINQEIEDAMQLLELGKIENAIYMLQQTIEKYPESEQVLMKLCEMALAGKNWAYAIELLEELAALKPDDVNVRLILMDIYKAYQMSIQEIITAREILVIDPGNLAALHRLAYLYHQQYMIEDEEETRKKITHLDPYNQENLKQLAKIYTEEDEVWNEIVVRELIYKNFPEDSINKRRLAYLYGVDKSLYLKLLMLEEILDESRTPLPRIKAEYRNTTREYKKELFMTDVVASNSIIDVLDTPDERIFRFTEDLSYQTFMLKSYSDFMLYCAYRGLYNSPKNNQEEKYNAGKIILGGTYHIATNDSKIDSSLTLGVDCINTFEIGTGVSSPAYTEDFLLFEATDNMKFFPFTKLNFTYELLQYLYLDLHFYSIHIEEIDSYITPLRGNDFGASLYVLFPDNTLFLIGCEMHYILEEFTRYRLLADLFYILYATNSIYNYNENRTGYLKDMPDTQIDVSFNFELYNYADEIPFNSEVETKHNYKVILGLSQKLKELLHLRIEGLGEVANTLDYTAGASLGLYLQNSANNVFSTITLYYHYQNTLPLFGYEAGTPDHNFGIDFHFNFNTY